MLEDFKLKVFMAVLEEQSFTKAARNLGISQPAVS
ncbi:MAG: LysR family transcriptional regulator [Bacteroidales bacterium]|nr:LysR family transcriptional regulator [Bacteroidales bacterium]